MIDVRRATVHDIEQLKNLVIASVLELCKEHYTPKELQSLLAQYPRRELYEKWIDERVLVVAEYKGTIVGFAQYFPQDSSIEAVHVSPGHAKQGIGQMVVARMEEIARHQGAKKITLSSSLNAIGFYEKCGYIRKDSGKFWCNDGVELGVVNFEKELQ